MNCIIQLKFDEILLLQKNLIGLQENNIMNYFPSLHLIYVLLCFNDCLEIIQ